MDDISFDQLIEDSKQLSLIINEGGVNQYDGVYGIPSGGLIPAYIIANELKLPLREKNDITEKTLIIDDIIDSGATIKKLIEDIKISPDIGVLYKKSHAPVVKYVLKNIDNQWINLPHESSGDKSIQDNIVRILEYLGENPNREGLKNTPSRVVKSYDRIFGGYKQKVEDILTIFESENYDEMVVLTDIEFYSTCEHHMLPFYGKAHVAYIPNGKIVGISKLARVVEIFSRRLQNQERITMQVANALQEALNAKGVAVVLEGKHFCMIARGVEKQNAIMKTAHLTGVFRDDSKNARQEFYSLINKK